MSIERHAYMWPAGTKQLEPWTYGAAPQPKPEKGRNGFTGYRAKVKDGVILITSHSNGKVQRQETMTLPLEQWPIYPMPRAGYQNYERRTIAEGLIVDMAKRAYNEEWHPGMARMADAVIKAIDVALAKLNEVKS